MHQRAQFGLTPDEAVDAERKRCLFHTGGCGNRYAVATLAFYLVEGAIRRRKQGFDVFAVLRKNCHSHGKRDRNRAHPVAQPEQMSASGGAGAFRNLNGAFLSCVGKQRHEFIAAVSCSDVVGAKIALKQLGHFDQNTVALKVTVGVVDEFEVVNIDNQQRERAAGSARGFDCRDRCFNKSATQQ
jgi:hypothetical protein